MDKSHSIYSFYSLSYFSHSSNIQLAVALKPFISMCFFPLSFLFLVQLCHWSHPCVPKDRTAAGSGRLELQLCAHCWQRLKLLSLLLRGGDGCGMPLPMQPGSMTISFLSYFLSLRSIWFPFSALQCQLINHSASRLILDKTISLSLPAFHKASMYHIKFVVLFPDKNELR